MTEVSEKFDNTLAEISKVLVEASNKYGPDVGEYVLTTIYYDALQWALFTGVLVVVSLVATPYFVKMWLKVLKDDFDLMILGVIITPPYLLLIFGTLFRLTDVYKWIALFGDPKITLTKQLMEKLL